MLEELAEWATKAMFEGHTLYDEVEASDFDTADVDFNELNEDTRAVLLGRAEWGICAGRR